MSNPLTYASAGVDIDKADKFIDIIKKISKETPRSGVMGEIGGFGVLFSLNLTNLERPVLVSSTDGVGTKLKIADMMNIHNTIGIDLVAMCVNDVAVQGAKPLFFLDYLSMGTLKTSTATEIIKGIAKGCIEANCALIGGETAEMPGMYKNNEYDLAGFVVGIVDNDKIIDGSGIAVGHKLIGIASNGLHSNGYSLVRKICFDLLKMKIDTYVPELGKTIGEELIIPTKIYSEIIHSFIKDIPIHGLAHITGGGIAENVVRVLPETCQAVIKTDSWDVPPVFHFLQDAGKISDKEMLRTFNNGLGMVGVLPADSAQELLERLNAMDEKAFLIGDIVERKETDDKIIWI
ncbi:MAG: phosphoribosylformylglycinamidine cyclo-ligase [Deltaproteobacteria bacterium]|nr:phosphoribosylformylglycinamidine cyclo-ligase [Deltaproteobacteria bacterium]